MNDLFDSPPITFHTQVEAVLITMILRGRLGIAIERKKRKGSI
jgi:hypothetical protein